MTDEEQWAWHRGLPGVRAFDTLEEFRTARRASRETALGSDNPMHRLEAAMIPEEAWWDPCVPS